MNKRFNELKNLASVWCDENVPEQFSEETNGYGKVWEDKFAELIVKECAIHLHKRGVEGFGILEERNLKEHFGIK